MLRVSGDLAGLPRDDAGDVGAVPGSDRGRLSPVKSIVAMTRFFSALWVLSIPESMTATVTPLPVSGGRSSCPAPHLVGANGGVG